MPGRRKVVSNLHLSSQRVRKMGRLGRAHLGAHRWRAESTLCSGENLRDDIAVDVGETALRAVVIEGQSLVVEAEDVKERGVEVVDGGDVLDGLVAEFV